MSNKQNPLSDLIRKVETDLYNPEIHGEGCIVTWHSKKREVVKETGMLASLFNRKHFEYFFVAVHSKPIVVRKKPLKWEEGTSDISLDFDATFQLKVSTQHEAEQLVSRLSAEGSAEKGLLKLIDKHLFDAMQSIYNRAIESNGDLLDEFYRDGAHKGESKELNRTVSQQMQQELAGNNFAIGFTLRNAPDRHAFINCKSTIKGTSLDVNSECQLTLTNYQLYRKSELQSEQAVADFIRSSIDIAVQRHILGKSLMELLSNFKSKAGVANKDEQHTYFDQSDEPSNVSISELIRESVAEKARSIGYEVMSLHTLPDIAALRLLTGLMVEFGEEDGSFRTRDFGGSIKVYIRMEVKAIDGQFDKHLHLLTGQLNGDQGDKKSEVALEDVTTEHIVTGIKGPIAAICKEVFMQQDHLTASQKFDERVKPKLINQLVKQFEEQYGLKVNIKLLQQREPEEAARLRELCRKQMRFSFRYASNNGDVNAPEITFKGGFEVLGIVSDSQSCWNAFEGQDFGYREDSPERSKSNSAIGNKPDRKDKEKVKEYDRKWKNWAIEQELKSIEEEIISSLCKSEAFIVDFNVWINDVSLNRQVQEKLLQQVEQKLEISRGLSVKLERLETIDQTLQDSRIKHREHNFKDMFERKKLESANRLEKIRLDEQERQTIHDALTNKKVDLIEDEVYDFEELEERERNVHQQYRPTTQAPEEIDALLPKSASKNKEKQALINEFLNSDNKQKQQKVTEDEQE